MEKDERERATHTRTARPHCTQHVVCASCALSHGVELGRCSVNEACTPSDGSGQKTSGPSTTTSSVAATGWRQNTADDHHQSLCLCAVCKGTRAVSTVAVHVGGANAGGRLHLVPWSLMSQDTCALGSRAGDPPALRTIRRPGQATSTASDVQRHTHSTSAFAIEAWSAARR